MNKKSGSCKSKKKSQITVTASCSTFHFVLDDAMCDWILGVLSQAGLLYRGRTSEEKNYFLAKKNPSSAVRHA